MRYPFYYGSDMFESKYDIFAEKLQTESFNTLFLGSSRVHRHINVNLFDKLNNSKTQSFNFGVTGCYAVEQMYNLNHILKDENFESIENIFIELQGQPDIPDKNVKTKQNFYFLDSYAIASYFNLKLINWANLKNFSKSIFYNLLSYRCSLYTFNIEKKDKNYRINNGFYPLNMEKQKYFKERNEAFKLSAGKTLNNIKNNVKKELRPHDVLFLNEISKISKENADINFYIIAAPNYLSSKPFKHENLNLLILDRETNKFLDNTKNYFDKAHFNGMGAFKYTKQIAEKFNAVSSSKKRNLSLK